MNKIKLHQNTEQKDSNLGQIMSDVILGGQDGLVNTLGVILGIAAATADIKVIVAGGLAGAVAEAVSMGAVGYTSKSAEKDYYQKLLKKEIIEMEMIPEMEREEIRDIYRAKGFKGKLLEDVVAVITSNKQVWLDTMMREELKVAEVDDQRPLRAAIWVGFSALIGSLVPLAPFLFYYFAQKNLNGDSLWVILASLFFSGTVLFLLGSYKAKVTSGQWLFAGLQIAIIGLVSALFGYLIGLVFGA